MNCNEKFTYSGFFLHRLYILVAPMTKKDNTSKFSLYILSMKLLRLLCVNPWIV